MAPDAQAGLLKTSPKFNVNACRLGLTARQTCAAVLILKNGLRGFRRQCDWNSFAVHNGHLRCHDLVEISFHEEHELGEDDEGQNRVYVKRAVAPDGPRFLVMLNSIKQRSYGVARSR